jgi:glucuronokinase
LVAISKGNKALIDAARGVGASAKFTGSGGAIIGTFTDQVMFHEIEKAMAKVGAVAIIPNIA